MAACPACTIINADDATACEMCGAALGSAPAAVKTCAHCTLENAADASACVACGAWWCPRCTRCVPAAVACCDVCGYPESADNDAAAAEAEAEAQWLLNPLSMIDLSETKERLLKMMAEG